MYLGSQERQNSRQAQHLFRKDRSCQVREDKEEETAEGQGGRQEDGHDQEIRRWIKEIGRRPDQEDAHARQVSGSQDEGKGTGQVQSTETKKEIDLVI